MSWLKSVGIAAAIAATLGAALWLPVMLAGYFKVPPPITVLVLVVLASGTLIWLDQRNQGG
jgi:hypothetical protein